jgi:sigma-E factor negative regulatory protein RseA
MTEQLRQSLSAVVDGEADAFELRRVLDELDRDPELRATWDRYHLIGSVIRGERTLQSRSAARVLERRVPLAVRESAPAANNPDGNVSGMAGQAPSARRFRSGRRRPALVGLAVAASVVLAAAIVLQPFGGVPAPVVNQPVVAQVDAGVIASAGRRPLAAVDTAGIEPAAGTPRLGERGVRPGSQADLRRAKAYMLQHAQQQGLEQRGVMSLVKMATYQAP